MCALYFFFNLHPYLAVKLILVMELAVKPTLVQEIVPFLPLLPMLCSTYLTVQWIPCERLATIDHHNTQGVAAGCSILPPTNSSSKQTDNIKQCRKQLRMTWHVPIATTDHSETVTAPLINPPEDSEDEEDGMNGDSEEIRMQVWKSNNT